MNISVIGLTVIDTNIHCAFSRTLQAIERLAILSHWISHWVN